MRSFRKSKALTVALWLTGGLLFLILLKVIGQGLNTPDRLTFVEHERDRWQKAPEILGPLQLQDGSRVADVGCGAGYFALKLAGAVEASGSVQAVDVLRLPLAFLWIRRARGGRHNIHLIPGEPDDPHISGRLDAALLADTYHELSRPEIILRYLHSALVPGGRLVVADRGADSASAEHAIDPSVVEAELRRNGFENISRNNHFLDQPAEGPWWLITVRRPYNEAKV